MANRFTSCFLALFATPVFADREYLAEGEGSYSFTGAIIVFVIFFLFDWYDKKTRRNKGKSSTKTTPTSKSYKPIPPLPALTPSPQRELEVTRMYEQRQNVSTRDAQPERDATMIAVFLIIVAVGLILLMSIA